MPDAVPAVVLAVLGRGVVDANTPTVFADDTGLVRGDGCFDGCRLRAGAVDKLDAHLGRFARSAAALDIGFDTEAWQALINDAAAAWALPGEAAMKLVITRGPAGSNTPAGYVWITPVSPEVERLRHDGLRVVTLDRGEPACDTTPSPSADTSTGGRVREAFTSKVPLGSVIMDSRQAQNRLPDRHFHSSTRQQQSILKRQG